MCSECFQGVFRVCSECVLVCSECVQSVFRVCSERVQSVFRVCSECVQSVFRVRSEYVQSMFNIEVISSPSASSVSIFGIFHLEMRLHYSFFSNRKTTFHFVATTQIGM